MEKLKEMTSSAPGKVKGLFRKNSGDNLHAVLQKRERMKNRDPFVDGTTLEEPTLPKSHMWIHFVTLFFSFLAICTIGATAGFQAKWVGVSGGTGFSIFLLLSNFFLTVFLLTVPIAYDKWDKFRKPAQFLQQARSTLILHVFGSLMGLIAAMIITISSFGGAGCKNPDNDPHASLGDDFKAGLGQWCTTKKACGIFCWLALGGWLVLTVLAVLNFRRERRREPSFIPPASPIANGSVGYTSLPGQHEHHDEDHNEKFERPSSSAIRFGGEERDVGLYNAPITQIKQERYEARMEPGHSAGAAFPLVVNQGNEPSRTMRMAYSDPYAQVRSLLSPGPGPTHTPPPQQYGYQPPYGNAPPPQPPQYNAYR